MEQNAAVAIYMSSEGDRVGLYSCIKYLIVTEKLSFLYKGSAMRKRGSTTQVMLLTYNKELSRSHDPHNDKLAHQAVLAWHKDLRHVSKRTKGQEGERKDGVCANLIKCFVVCNKVLLVRCNIRHKHLLHGSNLVRVWLIASEIVTQDLSPTLDL